MQLGTTVTLAYTGTTEDGVMFGYANAEKPMVFQTGMDLVIDGLEREILEMNEVGEKKTFTIGMYDAYGEYLEDFTQRIPKEQIPRSINFKPGSRIWLNSEEVGKAPATVIEVTNTEVVVDMNHPLAGKDLIFEVEILALEDAPENFVSAKERKEEEKRLEHMLGGGGAQPDDAMYFD